MIDHTHKAFVIQKTLGQDGLFVLVDLPEPEAVFFYAFVGASASSDGIMKSETSRTRRFFISIRFIFTGSNTFFIA